MKFIIATMLMFVFSFQVGATNQTIDKIRALKKERRDHALIFITQDGCPYCDYQRKINTEFVKYTGWTIIEKRIEDHPSVRARFNVTGTPTLIMVKKGSDHWNPVSLGAVDFPTMLNNSVMAANHMAGKKTGGSMWIGGDVTGVAAQ